MAPVGSESGSAADAARWSDRSDIGKHPLARGLEAARDGAGRAQVPQSAVELAQRQAGGDPPLRPSDLDAPRAPAVIGVRAPVFPLREVEGAEPRSVEFGMALGAHLDAHQECSQAI